MNIKELHTQEKPVSATSLFKSELGNATAIQILQGEKLKAALQEQQAKFPDLIKEVRGRGLMLGVEFSHDDIAGLVIAGMAARGVLAAYTLNNATVIRFEPPLIISDEQIAQAASAFSESLEQARELLEDIDMDED